MRQRILHLFVLGLCLASASCTKIIGIEDTELSVLPSNLQCVGSVVRPVGDGSSIAIDAQISNLATGVPIEGVVVRRCVTRLDIVCDNADVYYTDATGRVSVPVTSGFNGYLRIEDPIQDGASSRLVTYFWYFSEPIVATRPTPFPIYAMTRAYRDLAFYSTSPGDHSQRGEIAINTTDCQDVNASGVRLELTTPGRIDDLTQSFYFAGDQIVIEPATQETDGSGLGGFVWVKPGSAEIQAVHPLSGTIIAKDTLLVQPDVLTTVRLLPQ